MSTALEARGHDLSGSLWTARLLRDAPHEIAAVHRDYYRAGARVATAATYQASVPGFVADGMAPGDAAKLVVRGVEVARAVRDDLAADGVTRWVAASVGPYGALLADGSEYRGRYGLTPARLRDFHGPRLELLASAGPDLLAVETIPDVEEAQVLVGLIDEVGMPAWFSYSARGTQTCADQPLDEAFAVAGAARCVVAVGVNCCHPADVLPAVRLAGTVTGKPGVAYPNGGARWDAVGGTWRGAQSFDVGQAPGWVAAGVMWVGGCCGVGPGDIAALAAAVA
jgi:homocysteine S-methyltransferase